MKNFTTRKEAKQLGRLEYFTGRPCIRGHISPRNTSNGSCKECLKQRHIEEYANNREAHLKYSRDWKAANKDKVQEHNKEWDKNNPDKRKQYQQSYVQTHKETVAERGRKWRLENPNYHHKYNTTWRENNPNYARAYRDENRGKFLANHALYRAAKKQATVVWADQIKIEALYEEAKILNETTGEPHEVDHIVPLQHPEVCGLHCEDNLQILTRYDNRKKHNKL